MNKQFSLLLHSILISGALFALMPASPLVQPAAAAYSTAHIAQSQPDVMLISFGRGVPRSRSGGGTR